MNAALELGVRVDSFIAGVQVGLGATFVILTLLGGLALVRRIVGV